MLNAAFQVLLVAHRAGNDLDLLVPALEAGADLIEADVHLRRGRLEVRHAKSLGPLPWHWEPWYLLRPSTLRLGGLAANLPPNAHLMLDLKGWQPWLGRLVREAMQREAPDVPYTVCSRHWRTLDTFAGVDHVRTVHSVRTTGELAWLEGRLRVSPTWGVSIHRDLLTRPRVAYLREYADVVMTWPIDSASAYEAVVALGVNGVISNDLPALAREERATVTPPPAAGAADRRSARG